MDEDRKTRGLLTGFILSRKGSVKVTTSGPFETKPANGLFPRHKATNPGRCWHHQHQLTPSSLQMMPRKGETGRCPK